MFITDDIPLICAHEEIPMPDPVPQERSKKRGVRAGKHVQEKKRRAKNRYNHIHRNLES